jgi:shikimate kinase
MGVVLLGYRGSGKTTVGLKLADRLWCEFVDTDQEIVRRAGKSIKDIFAQDGEALFRDLESQVLADVLKRESDVISCGGGVVLRESNRELLRNSQHSRVYLRCEPEVLHKRIESDPTTAATRPALTSLGGGIEEIRTLMQQREPLYREVMTTELEVTNLDIDEVVVRVTKLV